MKFVYLSSVVTLLALTGCDDTGKAIKEEVQEIDKDAVKRDMKTAAAAVTSAARDAAHEVKQAAPQVVEGAKDAARETGKAIDTLDKKAADEIRKEH